MYSLPVSRTTRRLLKIASLGLAGLLAGLLSGCNTSPDNAANPHSHTIGDSSDTVSTSYSDLPESIEATQVPALHHPPSARRLQYGSITLNPPSSRPNRSNGS